MAVWKLEYNVQKNKYRCTAPCNHHPGQVINHFQHAEAPLIPTHSHYFFPPSFLNISIIYSFPCFWILYKWKQNMLSFVFGFFHSTFYLWDSFMLLHVVVGLSFSLLNTVPLYEYTTINLSILPLDIWVSCWELLCIMPLWTFLYVFFFF